MRHYFRPSLSGSWQRLTLALPALGFVLLLAACGFRLKGTSPLPFETLYTNISENTSFGAHLRRSLQASSPGVRFVSDPKEAQARLIQLSLNQSRREVSLSPQGQVEEYELKMTFRFELLNARGQRILPPTTLVKLREIPYDSSAFQAKQGEISSLFIGMQQSLVDQIVRRLTASAVHDRYQSLANAPADGTDADWVTEEDDDEPGANGLYDEDSFDSPLLHFP